MYIISTEIADLDIGAVKSHLAAKDEIVDTGEAMIEATKHAIERCQKLCASGFHFEINNITITQLPMNADGDTEVYALVRIKHV